ncbi:MAG: acyl-CoA dehydrogenase family protein [Elusimicrobiota bacterium]|jgi:hypothetical protein
MAKNLFADNSDIQFYANEYLDWKTVLDMKEDSYKKSEGAPSNFEEALDNAKTELDYLGKLVGDVIYPNAKDADHEGARFDAQTRKVILSKGTEQNLKMLGESGFLGVSLPRKYGGLNSSQTATTIASELLGAGDAGLMTVACLQWGVANVILHFAEDSVKDAYLPRLSSGEYGAAMVLTEANAGSDLGGIRTTATLDEASGKWKLNGSKQFITNGQREVLLVLARSEADTSGDIRGLSLFLVEGKDAQVTRLEEKLGLHSSPTCELVFKDSPGILIGKRGYGLIKYMFALMNEARLSVAAQGLGIAQSAYNEALKYSGEREQFGRKIQSFPPVADMLVRMKLQIESTRALIYRTAWCVDMHMELDRILEGVKAELKLAEGEKKEALKKKRDELAALCKTYGRYADVLTPLSKILGGRTAVEVCDSAIQVLGGYGYSREYPVERLFRDARIVDIYEGTAQMQAKAAIAGILNGALEPLIAQITEKAAQKANTDAEIKALLGDAQAAWKTLCEAVAHVKSHEGKPDHDIYLELHEGALCQMSCLATAACLLLDQTLVSPRKKIVAHRYLAQTLPQVRMLADYVKKENLDSVKQFAALTK